MSANGLAAASGCWVRRGPTIIVELGRSGFGGVRKRAASTTEGEIEFELVGGIPVEDYLRWVQGSLNLYFEKAGRPERVKANGEDSAEYRKAVKLFKGLAKVQPVDDTVDEKTQNALIKANESNPRYLAWLRSALDRAGYSHLTITYEKHEKPVAVIREFQRDFNGRFGFTLIADGFVGAKTHLALLHAIRPVKPKPPKPAKPIVVTDEQLFNKLLRAEEWIRENEDPERRPTELCLIAKLKRETTDDTYYDPNSIHGFMRTRLGSGDDLIDFALSARQTLKAFLKSRWETNRTVTPESVVQRLEKLVRDIVDGVRALQFSYCYDPRLPGAQKEIKDLATRRDSLYSCPNDKRLADTMKRCAG